jgi:hypothetical protein
LELGLYVESYGFASSFEQAGLRHLVTLVIHRYSATAAAAQFRIARRVEPNENAVKMLFAMLFVFWRVMQIITLIPTMGMLAWFVDHYVKANAMTPTTILVLFVVSVIALTWALFTLFAYHRSSTNALFVGLIDLAFVGAFIAAVWFLRGIAKADCTRISRDPNWDVNFGDLGSVSGPDFRVDTDKPCAMLKASFAFGIMNCIMFFFTAILAWMHGDRLSRHADRRYGYKDSHYRRHAHRSPRSSHSHHRVYV